MIEKFNNIVRILAYGNDKIKGGSMLLAKNTIHPSTHFENFKNAVSQQVFRNLSFNLMIEGEEHTTFDSLCERKITHFIKDVLKKLPIKIIQTINSVNDEKKFHALVELVAGSGKRDPQICLTNGQGLHFSGLTKLCYDIAHYYPKSARYTSHYPTLLHINEISLFKIKDPLNNTKAALEHFFS